MIPALLPCWIIPKARRRVRLRVNWRREWLRLRVGIAIAAGHRGGKAVSPSGYGFYETGFVGVVAQRQADLADRRVNPMIDIVKGVFAPKALGDLLAGYQLPTPLDQQDEQLHGEPFQAQQALSALEAILGLVKCEIAEMEFWGRKSSTQALT